MKKAFLFSLLCLMTMMMARAQQTWTLSTNEPPSKDQPIVLHDLDELKLNKQALKAVPTKPRHAEGVTLDNWTGDFIMNYFAAVPTHYDGGGIKNLVKEGDSIVVSDFVKEGFKFKMHIDTATGKVTIPVQQVGTYQGNPVNLQHLTVQNEDLYLDKDTVITGFTIGKDTIWCTDSWVLWVPAVKKYVYAGGTLTFARPNTTATFTTMPGGKVTRKIFIRPLNWDSNQIEVYNLCGYGERLLLDVRSDSTVRADDWYARNGWGGLDNVYFYTPINYELTETSIDITYAIKRIWGDIEKPHTVKWGLWFIGTEKGKLEQIYRDATLNVPFDIEVPKTVNPNVSGTGTEADPYLINNTADWDSIVSASVQGNCYVNKYIKVNADIDFTGKTFTPIASVSDQEFQGTLDGAGHTVTVDWKAPVAPYQGLLCHAEQRAIIKNLTVAGDITFNGNYCGGILGYASVGSHVINCTNKATLHVAGQYKGIGGIVGYGTGMYTIDGCTNEGTISYESTDGYEAFLGGIFGVSDGGNVLNCTNKGKFEFADASNTSEVGGIVGKQSYGVVKGCVNEGNITIGHGVAGIIGFCENDLGLTIANCINKGTIAVTDTVKDSNWPTGGIVCTLTDYTTIKNCVNAGIVKGNNHTGGIFGWQFGNYPSKVEKCVNAGTVKGNKEMVGGIGGFTTDYVTIDSCYNLGEVIAPDASRVAGIVGQLQGSGCKIDNCVNSGHVSGKFWVGGILGNQAGNYAATGCYNTGLVDGNSRAGGINGYSAYYSKVSESFNVGEIASRQDSAINNYLGSWAIGGLGGRVSTHYDNCYNAGLINGRVNSAGILANVYRSAKQDIIDYTASVTNSYNCGLVAGDVDSCGQIIGVHVANNNSVWRTKDWTYLDTIENVYYLDGINPNCIIEKENPQKGMTSAELCKLLPTDKFTNIGDYCYPVLKRFENNPWAKLYAAAIVPKEGNDLVNITEDFHIGAPADVKWTSSYAGLTITGNAAKFGKEAYNGEITLTGTAPAENLPMLAGTGVVPPTPTRTIVLKVNYKGNNDISDVNGDKVVKSVLYYNIAGQVSAEPFEGVNIVKTTYTDGTNSVAKVMK